MTETKKIVINRQPLGVEDLAFGNSTVEQIRGGSSVYVTEINASNMPFNESSTLKEALDTRYAYIELVGSDLSKQFSFVNDLGSITDPVEDDTGDASSIITVANNIANINIVADNIDAIIAGLSAAGITVDTTNLDGILSGVDNTVQKALETLDDSQNVIDAGTLL